jgi:hypothetical protein
MIHRYWWGAENGKRKTHWVAWDIMLRPKYYGGVGFRDMRLFNQALLARQAWRLIQYPDTLCAQLLKARYFPLGSLIDTVFTGNGSPACHAIEHGLELLKKGVIWRVGNGAQIQAWRDPWIPRDACLLRHRKADIGTDGSLTSCFLMVLGMFHACRFTLEMMIWTQYYKLNPQVRMILTLLLGTRISEGCLQSRVSIVLLCIIMLNSKTGVLLAHGQMVQDLNGN